MKVRFATAKDKKQVLALLDELDEEIYRKRGDLTHKGTASTHGGTIFDEIISRNDTLIIVAEEGDILLGLINFFLLPNIKHGWHRIHVEDVVVSEKYRGLGIGTKLFDFLKSYCRDHHIHAIKLDSGLELPDAHNFYEKNGGKFTEKMFRFDL